MLPTKARWPREAALWVTFRARGVYRDPRLPLGPPPGSHTLRLERTRTHGESCFTWHKRMFLRAESWFLIVTIAVKSLTVCQV